MPFARSSNPRAAPAGALGGARPAERRLAVADRPDPEAILARLQCEVDAGVRHAMLTRLGMLSGPRVAVQLVSMLASEDVALRNDANLALRRCRGVAVPALAIALQSADPDVQIFSANALEGIFTPSALALLTDLLTREADANVCLAAVEALAQMGAPADAAAFADLCTRFPGEPGLGFAVALALDTIGAGA